MPISNPETVISQDRKRYRLLSIVLLTFLIFLFFILYYIGFDIMNQHQTLTFEPNSRTFTNPLIGWAPWANSKRILQPHTLVYADLTWRDFEPSEGVYDFSSFEERNRLDEWKAEGKRVVFRFVMDVPRDEQHLDIPDWLYEKTGSNGDHYDIKYGKGYSPDYNDPLLIAAHQRAIQALGDRYGDDDFFAYIELGSLGHWGEWHVKSDSNIRPLPLEEVRDQYVMHYINAFPKTHLLMRRPFKIASELGLGLYNDMTGDVESTDEWLIWIQNGGEYTQTGEKTALVPMSEAWQQAPFGGEQSGSVPDQEMYGTHLDQTLNLLKDSHATFIGPGGPYDLEPGNPLQSGMDQVLSTIGYRFYISKIKMPRNVHLGKTITATVVLENQGVAPIYYDWPIKFYLFDKNGQEQTHLQISSGLDNLLPGENLPIEFTLPITDLSDGVYTLAVGIIDPITGEPAVQFAMDNPRSDLIQELGSFEFVRLFRKLDPHP